MSDSALHCLDERRRADVRRAPLYGLDGVEVSDDQRTLHVNFLGRAPATSALTLANVRIRGGRRVRGVRVIGLEIHHSTDLTRDDSMDVLVDVPGDFSAYTLSVVHVDAQGHVTDDPLDGFDPRYSQVDFSFKLGCPSDLDCASEPCCEPCCPPPVGVGPEISYLAKDYASFRQLMFDRLALLLPEWRETHVPDLGVTLVELLAYVGDYLSYYQDAVATEAYLGTARRRISVRRHARLVDYAMHEGANARAWVTISTDTDVDLTLADVTFMTRYPKAPEDRRMLTPAERAGVASGGYEVFEPLWWPGGKPTVRLRAAHDEIRFYTWGDHECCLARGATSATLEDWKPGAESAPTDASPLPRVLRLREGDVLVFEEVVGPRTGKAADADPTHRQAVRLTRARRVVDPLYDRPLVDIEWAAEDALTFPLCLSARASDCSDLSNVSVAHGNVLLVDHGQSVGEPLGSVPTESTNVHCPTDCTPAEIEIVPGRFRPVLGRRPLTFSEPLPAHGSAASLLRQDPRRALPSIRVRRVTPAPAEGWTPRRDLLGSVSDARDFAVEVDDDGYGHLRFGDGDLGMMPSAGAAFEATYRVGNGVAGNVGAEAIAYLVLSETLDGVTLVPRNPLPAVGGTEPEPVAEVRQLAPQVFRETLLRAVTADDYATLAGQHGGVQGATAALRWTGSWYEALVAVDPLGAEEAPHRALADIAKSIEPARRLGHDLRVASAHYVPLEVELRICVRPHHLRGHVKAELLKVFTCFFHPDNLRFGGGVFASTLVSAAQAVTGVQSVEVIRLERAFEGPNGEVRDGVLRLGPLEIARLDNDPSLPEHGRLVLTMGGGR